MSLTQRLISPFFPNRQPRWRAKGSCAWKRKCDLWSWRCSQWPGSPVLRWPKLQARHNKIRQARLAFFMWSATDRRTPISKKWRSVAAAMSSWRQQFRVGPTEGGFIAGYSSALGWAYETANQILRGRNQQVKQIEDLKDISWSNAEGDILTIWRKNSAIQAMISHSITEFITTLSLLWYWVRSLTRGCRNTDGHQTWGRK